MAQQLIFTSAVAGLNPGSSGYCTVARSETMRDAVVTRLEQWSVYTHQAGGQNPVVCAYRVLNLRGSVFHVLTRIVDSGLDYTGRTNFLAHHLVFQPHEIHGACSPAEVFLQWPGWVNQWQGAPRYLEDDGLSLHGIPRSTKMPAETWKQWAGDAGAATLLVAEGDGSATARATDLVVPAGSETVLPHLYAESLHLVDPKGENAPAAWAVPFTTFLQPQDDVGDFRWRGMLSSNSSKGAEEVLLDFTTSTLPPIVFDSLASYARTGKRAAVFLPKIEGKGASYGQTNVGSRTATTNSVGTMMSPPLLTTRRASMHRQQSPSATTREKVPLWVWLCTVGIIPIGVAAGVWIARPKDQNPPVKSAPPLAATLPTPESNVTVEATLSSNTAVPSPAPTVAPSLVEPTPTPVSAAELAIHQKQDEEARLAAQELEKLPDGPVYLTVGSVKSLKIISPETNNPLGELLRSSSKERGSIKVEVRYDSLDKEAFPAKPIESVYDNQQIVTVELSYVFKAEEISTTENFRQNLIWLTLNSRGAKYPKMHFILANRSEFFNQRSFRLSRRLFSKDNNAPIFRISEAARQGLTKVLESWIGLEPFGENGQAVRFALHATLKNPVDGKKVTLPTNQNFEVSFQPMIDGANATLKAAQQKVEDLEKRAVTGPTLAEMATERQSRLLKPDPFLPKDFPSELLKDLSVDSYRVEPTMSGLRYYRTLHAWVQQIAGDDNHYSQEAKGFDENPREGRFVYLKNLLQSLQKKADQQVAKETQTETTQSKQPPPPTRNRKLQVLASYLLTYLKDSDEAFINDSNNAQSLGSTATLQTLLNQARENLETAKRQTQIPVSLDHVDLWLSATINKSSVHLVEFVDDEANKTRSPVQEAPQTAIVP